MTAAMFTDLTRAPGLQFRNNNSRNEVVRDLLMNTAFYEPNSRLHRLDLVTWTTTSYSTKRTGHVMDGRTGKLIVFDADDYHLVNRLNGLLRDGRLSRTVEIKNSKLRRSRQASFDLKMASMISEEETPLKAQIFGWQPTLATPGVVEASENIASSIKDATTHVKVVAEEIKSATNVVANAFANFGKFQDKFWMRVVKVGVLLAQAPLTGGIDRWMLWLTTLVLMCDLDLMTILKGLATGFGLEKFLASGPQTTTYFTAQVGAQVGFDSIPVFGGICAAIADLFNNYIFEGAISMETLEKMVKRFGNLARGITSITTLAEKLWNWLFPAMFKVAMGFDYNTYKLQEVMKGLAEWREKLMKYMSVAEREILRTDAAACRDIEALYKQGYQFMSRAAELQLPPKEMQVLTGFIRLSKELYDEVVCSGASRRGPRMEPLVIMLRGQSGVGKTTLVSDLSVRMVGAVGMPKDSEGKAAPFIEIYTRNIEQEFWCGYTGQKICIYDDFGQLVDSPANPNLEFLEIIRTGHIGEYPLNMADIPSKDKTFFKSEVVIMTTNLGRIAPTSIVCPEAVRRRITHSFEVEVKEEFRKPDSMMVDVTKLCCKTFCKHIYRFVERNEVTEILTGNTYTYDQMVALCNASYLKQRTRSFELKGYMQEVADRFTAEQDFVDLFGRDPMPSGLAADLGVQVKNTYENQVFEDEENPFTAPEVHDIVRGLDQPIFESTHNELPSFEDVLATDTTEMQNLMRNGSCCAYRHVFEESDGKHTYCECELAVVHGGFWTNYFGIVWGDPFMNSYVLGDDGDQRDWLKVRDCPMLAMPALLRIVWRKMLRTSSFVAQLGKELYERLRALATEHEQWTFALGALGTAGLSAMIARLAGLPSFSGVNMYTLAMCVVKRIPVYQIRDAIIAKVPEPLKKGLSQLDEMLNKYLYPRLSRWRNVWLTMGLSVVALGVFRTIYKRWQPEPTTVSLSSALGEASTAETICSLERMEPAAQVEVFKFLRKKLGYSDENIIAGSPDIANSSFSCGRAEQYYDNVTPKIAPARVEQYYDNLNARIPPAKVEQYYDQAAPKNPIGKVEHEMVTVVPKKKMEIFAKSFIVPSMNVGLDCVRLTPEEVPTPQLARDPCAKQIATKIIKNVYYMECCRKEGDQVREVQGVLRGFFIRGRIMLTARHFRPYVERATHLHIANGFNPEGFTVPVSELKMVDVKDALGEYKDQMLIQFPRIIQDHPDLMDHLAHPDETSRFTKSRGCLIVPGDYIYVHHSDVSATDIPVYYDDEEMKSRFHLRKSYTYQMETQAGDCGSPLMVQNPHIRRKIVGIHVAGSSDYRGHSSPINVLDIERALNFFCLEAQVRFDIEPLVKELSNAVPMPEGNFIPVGVPEFFSRGPAKTSFVRSSLQGIWKPPTTRPAALAPFWKDGALIDPLMLGLKKSGSNPKVLNPRYLAAAKRSVDRLFTKDPARQRVYSLEEASCGVEGDAFAVGVPRTTSAGYPYKFQTNKPGKKEFLGETKEDTYIHPRLRADVERRIELARANTRYPTLWLDTKKDERRPHEKVLAGKTRIFSAGPVDFTLAMRMYFLGFAAHVMDCRIDNGIAVGTNVYSSDWARIAERLMTKGTKVIAGDFSNYDGTLNPDLLGAVLDVINTWYGGTEEETQIRTVLWKEIVNSVHVYDGTVYLWNHSQPSGNPLTAILNSVYNVLSLRYVWMDLTVGTPYHTMGEYERNVADITYGDDNAINISNEVVGFYNQVTMAASYAKFGMTYTDETKSGEMVAYRTLSDIQFLKRKFEFDLSLMRWRAPLTLETILEMPNWVRRTPDINTDAQTCLNVEAAVRELAIHGEEIFEEHSSLLLSACRALGLTPVVGTYYEYVTQELVNYGGLSMPGGVSREGTVSLADPFAESPLDF